MVQSARPLSPHLQVYKPQLTSVLSIFHRISGVISFLGSLCLLLWLTTLAWDKELYLMLQKFAVSWPIQLFLFLWSFSLIYHLFNGIRHLRWDAGKGFSLEEIYQSGKVVMIASLVVNILIWVTR
ncbi:MAG: succinate dehydrogenase, cytochrome b556 subunit [Cocleimonas sp.]|nr:succinate dehydrogenase, cytochrome b556 subunit [Cocleimonas sp.]